MNTGYYKLLDQISMSYGNPSGAYENNTALKILFSIPFEAGCSEPERIALINANNYFLMSSKGYRSHFYHNHNDDSDIYRRISVFDIFKDGDRQTIQYGMDALALIMIQDYKADMEDDVRNGKYNPLVSGVWSFSSMREEIIDRMRAVSCKLKERFPLNLIMNTGFWKN